jgi:lipopolysaccharide export system protein LptA
MVQPLPTPIPMQVRTFLLIMFLLVGLQAFAQEGARVEILNADAWQFDDTLAPGAQRLIGNVRFKHENALMNCDSAYLYNDQWVEAFGNVNIRQGDTLSIHGERLSYTGRERIARMSGNVRLRDKDMELITPSLVYDLKAGQGFYTEGGTATSRLDNSTLISEQGTYISGARKLVFSRNVRVVHPQRLILSDTLHYTPSTGITEFFGPTTITQDSTVIHTTRGTYDTKAERARFSRRSRIDTKGRSLEGDSIHYERKNGIGIAWGNVVVTDTTSDILAKGDHGRYDEKNDRSMITGHAEMIMIMDDDSLFLHGDTLFTRPDSDGRHVQAHRGVRFFKSDMQGVCDTLTYNETEGYIRMFHRPAIWNGADQITGDHIKIQMVDGDPHRLFVEKNAFLISQVDSIHFDQVTGTNMTGYFIDSEMKRIIAEGNSRTVYFAREEKEGSEEIIGVNRADCSRITVELEDGQVSTISFLERPDATFYPLEKVPPEELKMKGADWRGDERPTDRNSIFKRPGANSLLKK